MSLIKCTECNKKFSEYANDCPNCMCPIEIIKENNLIKKEEQYNKAINIIETYKTKKELYKAKQILTSLDNYKESATKIKEIDNLINYYQERQKINIEKIFNKNFNKKRMITILNFIIIVLCIFKLMDGNLIDELMNETKEYYQNEINSLAIKEVDKLRNTLIMNGYINVPQSSDFITTTQSLIKETDNGTYSFSYNPYTISVSFKYRSSQIDELANNISISFSNKNYKCQGGDKIECDIIENSVLFSCALLKNSDNFYTLPFFYYKNYNDETYWCRVFRGYLGYDEDSFVDCGNAVVIDQEIEKIKDEISSYIKETNVNIDIIKKYNNMQ